jgi:TonB-dependent receptor
MRIILSVFVLLTLFLSSSALYGQGTKGQVEGYVKDEASGDVLPYASVYFFGTTNGALTDDKGFYRIKNISPGSYQLRANFVGYTDTTYNLVIKGNETVTLDIPLSMSSTTIGVAVVTAQAYGQLKAINTQITSPIIKNVVSDEKIKELPDANAAEALSRLPGVSVYREGGEAVAVNIRGVSSNAIYVNGMRLDGGLGGISSSMIGGIELSKAFLPDQDADILGGAVDFKMREALPGFKKDVWLRTGYNGFTKSFRMQDFSVLLSDRFFNNKLGVMLSLNYDRKDRGRDVLSAGYEAVGSSSQGSEDIKPVKLNGVTLNHTENLNNRYGVTIFTDYKLKNGRLFYQGFFSGLESDTKSATNNYTNSARIVYTATMTNSSNKNIMNGIGGEHTIFGVKIDWGVSLSQKRNKTPYLMTYTANNVQGMTNVNTIDSSTTITQFLALGVPDLDQTGVDQLSKHTTKDYSDELGYKLNLEIPYKLGNLFSGTLKFGGKIRDIDRGYDNTSHTGSFRTDSYEKLYLLVNEYVPDFNWTFLPTGNLGHRAFTSGQEVQDFSMLGAKTYFFPDFHKVDYVYNKMKPEFDQMHYTGDELARYKNSEHLYAGYIMTQLKIGQFFTFIPGVRYEHYEYKTTARKYLEGQGSAYAFPQGIISDTTNGSYNAHWFPMVHLKFKPVQWFDVRIGYTRTLSRPGYGSMSPRYYRTINYDLYTNNVFLKPQMNTNYDVYLSFYTGKIGLLTVGGFYKKLEDQPMYYQVTIIDPATYNLGAAYKNKQYGFWINNKWPGYVKGIELDWQTQFSYLPRPFNGIILNANVTFMQSETRYPFYSFTTKTIPKPPFRISEGKDSSRVNKITGMPGLVGNIALGYELGGFSGRISAYYQGPTITAAQAANKTIDQDRDKLLRLDLQLSQKIRKGIMIYLNINNITNNPDRLVLTYYTDHVVNEEKYGVSGDIGVRLKF